MDVILICILILAILLIVLFLAWVLLLRTNGTGRKAAFAPFEACYIAHRGFFNNEGPAPENSMAAFRAAIRAGYGIETDVQSTKDGKLILFHDDDLKRMCGIDKLVEECTYEELQQYYLANSLETAPLFSDFLKTVDGKVPLIIEIKGNGDWLNTTKKAARMLDDYKGIYCVESFHPMVVAWMRKNRPQVVRGQLSTNYFADEPQAGFFKKFILTNLLLNFKTRPDFIAFNHPWKNLLSYRLCRKLYHPENVAWTIKSQKELEAAKDVYDVFIFDSFVPAPMDAE